MIRPVDFEYAVDIATRAHYGQTDAVGEPYILHIFRVMNGVREHGFVDNDHLSAAALHDLVEDTDWTLERLKDAGISVEVIEAVDALTHRIKEPYPAYINRAGNNEIAKIVKIADLRDHLGRPTAKTFSKYKTYEDSLVRLLGTSFIGANGMDSSGLRESNQPLGVISLQSRFRGVMFGLAAGDAVGTTLEFQSPGSFAKIDDMVGGGPFHLAAGEWTDDTSMALCLAESLVEKRGFDPTDQLERYTRWAKNGHLSSNGRAFDIGNTVRAALAKFTKTHEPFCGSSDAWSAGNGSLMRLAPVPLFYVQRPQEAIQRSGDSSRTTHAAATAVDACRYFGGLIISALLGVTKEELLSDRYAPIKGYWQSNKLTKEIDDIAAGSFKRSKPPTIRGSGHVVKCLEAALWAFYSSDSFREGCLLAVNLGDDADTTGAVYGQIAGAYYGEKGIPSEWRQKLAHVELIESFANALYEHRMPAE